MRPSAPKRPSRAGAWRSTSSTPIPTLRLPHALVVELMHDFVDVAGEPSAPLRAGFKLQLGDYELLEYLCTSCPTLGETIACLGRYYPLLIAAEYELHIEGDRAETRFQIAPGLAAPDCLYEFALASNFTMAALHLQLEGAQLPIEVCFAHARAGACRAASRSCSSAPVRFGCEHNALVFPVSMLEQPMRTADPLLHAVLTRLADVELAALADQSAFPAKVREAIEAELEHGAALDAVAERLHMSASGLRSRLRQHGATYSALRRRPAPRPRAARAAEDRAELLRGRAPARLRSPACVPPRLEALVRRHPERLSQRAERASERAAVQAAMTSP